MQRRIIRNFGIWRRSNMRKIRADEIMIGDWVQVRGIPVEVRMVSRRKIGYHLDGDKTRLVYARLADVEPLIVKKIEYGTEEWVVNDEIKIKVGAAVAYEIGTEESYISNMLGESLRCDFLTGVHELQHVLKIISRL
jgi:hypothetical protein